MAVHRDACSVAWSSTIRTARARTSGENLFAVLLITGPSSQELGPPTIPGRFTRLQVDVSQITAHEGDEPNAVIDLPGMRCLSRSVTKDEPYANMKPVVLQQRPEGDD